MTQPITDYVNTHKRHLDMLKAMWEDPLVQCYDDTKLPDTNNFETVFLAGPSSREQNLVSNWRCKAVFSLRKYGYKGYIYIPEPRGEGKEEDFTEKEIIYSWESSRLLSADLVMFWIPRNSSDLMGLNTNLELGIFLGKLMTEMETGRVEKGNIYVGWPIYAKRMGLPEHYIKMVNSGIYSNLNHMSYCLAHKRR